MPHWFRKLLSRKGRGKTDTPKYLIQIPPPPPDYEKSIPPEITEKTGNSHTLDGKLARAELADRRAAALHTAAVASVRYAETLTKIAGEAVACAEQRAQSLLTRLPDTLPPPYEKSSHTADPISTAHLCTVDDILERAEKANRDAKELWAIFMEANVYGVSLAKVAQREVTGAQARASQLLKEPASKYLITSDGLAGALLTPVYSDAD